MRATGSPPSGLSLKRANPAKVTRNRPRGTGAAWVAVNGSRNRRFRRTVSCPSGVLRSSAVSAMEPTRINRADDTTARQGRGRSTAAQGRRNGTFRARSCRETGPPHPDRARAGAAHHPAKRAARRPPFARKFAGAAAESVGRLVGRLVDRGLVAVRGRRGGGGLDAVQEIVGHLQGLVVLGVRRHVGLRAGLLVAF